MYVYPAANESSLSLSLLYLFPLQPISTSAKPRLPSLFSLGAVESKHRESHCLLHYLVSTEMNTFPQLKGHTHTHAYQHKDSYDIIHNLL